MFSKRLLALSVLGLLVAAAPAARAQPATKLLCLDFNAHAASATSAGALFEIDLSLPSDADPRVEAAADGNAPFFRFVSGLAVSPIDGRAYISDLGDTGQDGSLHAVRLGTGLAENVAPLPGLPDPWALAFTSTGRLAVVDWDADPSGFGPDPVGGTGPGAVFWLDPVTGEAELLADGTRREDMPGLEAGETAFVDPQGIAWDAADELFYVADFSADPLGLGAFAGALYSVDRTGFVRLVAAHDGFAAVSSCAVRQGGSPLVVDPVEGDSILWEVVDGAPDPRDSAFELTRGGQYGLLEGAVVDGADQVFVADSGLFDDLSGTYLVDPGVLRVDESNPDVLTNGVLVNGSLELLTPVNLAIVPTRLSAGLGVTRRLRLPLSAGARVTADEFDAGCAVAPWTLCPQEVFPEPLGGLRLPEAARTGRCSLWLYQHSDATQTMRLRVEGADIVFSAS